MTSKDILLHSQISALLIPYQRGFLWQQMGTNTETHSQTLCRELRDLGTSRPKE